MPKPPTTIAGFRSALLALGGPRCSVTCAVHYSDHVSPGHTFQSEEWTASVTVLEGDRSDRHKEHELVSVRAWGHSPEDVLMKLRAALRDALAARARQRKLDRDKLRLPAPPPAIEARPLRRLPHLPLT